MTDGCSFAVKAITLNEFAPTDRLSIGLAGWLGGWLVTMSYRLLNTPLTHESHYHRMIGLV